MKKFIKIVTDILLVIVLVMAAVLYIPRLMGLKTYKVLSGSMEPEYHVGSVVYVEKSLIDDIEHNTPESSQEKIKLDEIRPNPYQPRKVFDEQALNELALSIQEHGIFQPVILKKSVQGYEIVAGERRCRAARMAHLEEVPAIIVDFSDQQMMEIALLENIQREDLNAIEEAQAYQTMMEKLKLTQNELAKRIGKSRTHITNTLRL